MNKLAPKYGRATSNAEMSLAATTLSGGFRLDGRFRRCDDLGSFRWESVDDFNHGSLKYPTQRDFTNVTLAFRYESSASHKPLDSNQAPTLTIRDDGVDKEVRLFNPNPSKSYATRVSGVNTQAVGTVSVAVNGTELGKITDSELDNGGTGYEVGNILTVSGGSGTATVRVDSIFEDGVIQSLSLQAQGYDYSVANGVSCSGGSGSGATVNILAVATQTVKILIGLVSGFVGCTPSYSWSEFPYTANKNDPAVIAAGLRDSINASAVDVAATASGNVVTITAVAAQQPGIDGNGIQLDVTDSANITLTPPGSGKLSGGTSAGVWDVTIPFNTVKAGVDDDIEIDETKIDRVLFNFVSQNYRNFPDDLAAEDFWVEFTNWSVTGAGAFLFDKPGALRQFPNLGVALGYDDLADKTPEWVVSSIQQLGFSGLINIYVGAQRFYDKSESGAGPSGWLADTAKTFNPAARAWLADLAQRLAAAGYKTVWAFSLELFDPNEDWTQRDYLNNHAATAFGYVLSPTDAAFFLKGRYQGPVGCSQPPQGWVAVSATMYPGAP